MRKVLLSLIVSVLLLVLAANSVLAGGVIKFGVELPGSVEISAKATGYAEEKDKQDTEMGFSVAGEYFFDLNENLAVGAGAEYQLRRKVKDAEKGFNYIPIYALGRYQIDSTFYLTGKIGYNLFQPEDFPEEIKIKGGLFFGLGGGAVFQEVWQIEVLYAINNGGFKIPEEPGYLPEIDIGWKYSKIGVSVGYKF
jgi:hypothetical protein